MSPGSRPVHPICLQFFRGNFHFVSSRHLASCFGSLLVPFPAKSIAPGHRDPWEGQQGLAQATGETCAGLVLTPLSRASLQIFTFMSQKTPRKILKNPKLLQNILFQAAAGISEVPSEAGRAAALTVDYPFPLNFSLHFLSPPSWEEQLRLWSLCCSWSAPGKGRKWVTLEMCPFLSVPERGREDPLLFILTAEAGEAEGAASIPIPCSSCH